MQFANNLNLGQYIPGDSFIHRLDPRCKIIGTLILLCGIFLITNPSCFFIWSALLLGISRVARLPIRQVLRSSKPIWVLVLFTAFLHLFWTPGRSLLSLGFLHITQEGLLGAWTMGTRLLFLVIFASILMMTTSPMSFSDGLERLLSPLERFGFPSQEMAMMTTIALRFIPTLLEETDRILKAQLSRGADFESGGIMKRIRAFVPVLIPLFVQVFQRAENLAIAMESRCYQNGVARSRLNPLVWDKGDSFVLLFLCSLITAVYAMYSVLL